MSKKETSFNKLKTALSNFAAQWKTPAEGNYVSYREIVNYSVGGMGREMILLLVNYLGLGIGNTLFGSVLGIRPTHVQAMNTIVLIMDIFFIALRAKIVDNTNTRWGRFRPYIALVPVPLFLISAGFMFLPFETMTYATKLAIIFCFSVAVVFVRPYYEGSVSNLGNVITPNAKERIKVLSIYSILYSAAPTIYGIVINVLADQTGGYTDIRTYRYVIVPTAAVGIVLSMFAAFGCKERFIRPKGYVPRAKLFQSTKEIFKNKYWWLRTLSQWLAFMEWAVGNMFLWSFVYGSQNMSEYAVYNLFIGESATIAMLLTPFLLSRWGNRKLIVFQNTMNIVFLAIMLFTFRYPVPFFFVWFLNSLVNYFGVIYKPVFTAEVNDYQHYISGKRLDGMMSFANQIGLPITIATSYFVPFLFEAVGITTDYDILYEPMVRNRIFSILIIVSVIGACLNLAPLLFYDYSREKHKMIVRVLRFRTMLNDNLTNSLTAETLKSGLDSYYEYREICNAPAPDLKEKRQAIAQARKLPHGTAEEKAQRKQQLRAAKKAFLEAKMLRDAKKETFLFQKDLEKFDSDYARLRLHCECRLAECKPEELTAFLESAEYEALFDTVPQDDKQAAYLRRFRKKCDRMLDSIHQQYPNGLVEPDREAYENAQSLPHKTKEEIRTRFEAMKKTALEHKKYEKTVQHYLECRSYASEYLGTQHLQELESRYDDACIEVEQHKQERLCAEQEEKQRAQAAIEALKRNNKRKKLVAHADRIRKSIAKCQNKPASDRNQRRLQLLMQKADLLDDEIAKLSVAEESDHA